MKGNPNKHEDGGGEECTKLSALKKRVKALLAEPENGVCSECRSKKRSKKPKYMALLKTPIDDDRRQLGVFCCSDCHLFHVALGEDLCQVKSLKNPEEWTEQDVDTLEKSGNKVVNAIYESGLGGNHTDKHMGALASTAFVESKYKHCLYFSEEAMHEQMQVRAMMQFLKNEQPQEAAPPPPTTEDLVKKALKRQKQANKQQQQQNQSTEDDEGDEEDEEGEAEEEEEDPNDEGLLRGFGSSSRKSDSRAPKRTSSARGKAVPRRSTSDDHLPIARASRRGSVTLRRTKTADPNADVIPRASERFSRRRGSTMGGMPARNNSRSSSRDGPRSEGRRGLPGRSNSRSSSRERSVRGSRSGMTEGSSRGSRTSAAAPGLRRTNTGEGRSRRKSEVLQAPLPGLRRTTTGDSSGGRRRSDRSRSPSGTRSRRGSRTFKASDFGRDADSGGEALARIDKRKNGLLGSSDHSGRRSPRNNSDHSRRSNSRSPAHIAKIRRPSTKKPKPLLDESLLDDDSDDDCSSVSSFVAEDSDDDISGSNHKAKNEPSEGDDDKDDSDENDVVAATMKKYKVKVAAMKTAASTTKTTTDDDNEDDSDSDNDDENDVVAVTLKKYKVKVATLKAAAVPRTKRAATTTTTWERNRSPETKDTSTAAADAAAKRESYRKRQLMMDMIDRVKNQGGSKVDKKPTDIKKVKDLKKDTIQDDQDGFENNAFDVNWDDDPFGGDVSTKIELLEQEESGWIDFSTNNSKSRGASFGSFNSNTFQGPSGGKEPDSWAAEFSPASNQQNEQSQSSHDKKKSAYDMRAAACFDSSGTSFTDSLGSIDNSLIAGADKGLMA